MKTTLLFGLVSVSLMSPGSAVWAQIESSQYSRLLSNNVTQSLQAIENVKKQIEQIKQLKDQISLDQIRNDILGEYGLGDITDFEKTLDSFRGLGNVDSLDSILGKIKVDDIWKNTSGGAFAPVEPPKSVDKTKYQSHAAAESAFKASMETQARVKKENVDLGKEAIKHRELAAAATDEATYQQHIDKAEAADMAIDRNNELSQASVDNALAMHAAAEMDDRKREKAENDRAREKAREDNKAMSDAFQDFDFKID